MSADDLRFREPPPTKHSRGRDYAAIFATLQQRPGEWAIIAEGLNGKGSYSYIRAQLVTRGCEVTTRTTAEGIDVYVRWPVGGGTPK